MKIKINKFTEKEASKYVGKLCRVWTTPCDSQLRLITAYVNCDKPYFLADNGARFFLWIRLITKKELQTYTPTKLLKSVGEA